jgi:hypothetical protein
VKALWRFVILGLSKDRINSLQRGYPASNIGMFDRGPVELVEYFIDKANRNWIDKLSTVDLARYFFLEQTYSANTANLFPSM